jgi:menaquinol-cytochrome c reductase iron-sulfur subunit
MSTEKDEPNVAEGGHDDHGEHDEQPPASPELVARRRFLARVSVGLGGCMGLAVGAPLVGFVVAPLFRQVPFEWRAVGKVNAFKVGETVAVIFVDASPLPWAGVTAKTAAWLRRKSETEFVAFAVNCAHLGCPVRWLPDAQLFMCPCHGGVYYADGSVAAGPPPHSLSQYKARITGDDVEIHTEPIPID